MRVQKKHSTNKVVANLAQLNKENKELSYNDTLRDVQDDLVSIISKLSPYATHDADHIVNRTISGCAVLSMDITKDSNK